jgi:predicted ATP-grasp superfamily ATP-dependent carboligase
MNILILHRIPYHKIDYHRGIDHAQHRVIYLGTEEALSSIPEKLNCERWSRPGIEKTEVEAIKILTEQSQTFNCVISLSEYELMSAAIIRDHFSIAGASIEQIDKVRNKLLMKNSVEASGIAVPQNLSLLEFVDVSNIKWQGQTVLKPLDGASSENVLIFDSPSSLRDTLRNNETGIEQLDSGDYSNYGVEQFIKGDILHIDGLILNGVLKLIVTSQYIGNCLDFAGGSPLGSIQIETTNELKQWTTDVLKATELTTGSFHLEAIVTEQGPVFLEVANRVGGADVVDAVELATGVHLPSVELKAYLGEPIYIPKQTKKSKKYGWFVFPGHHLEQQYCVVNNTERFSQDPRIVRWKQLNTSQKLTKHITYQATEVPISGVVGAQTSQKISEFIHDLFATATVR